MPLTIAAVNTLFGPEHITAINQFELTRNGYLADITLADGTHHTALTADIQVHAPNHHPANIQVRRDIA